MFQKLQSTQNPPAKSTLVWDGKCAFCAYWIKYWQDLDPGRFDYIAYQDLNGRFPDIDIIHFKEAVRLIDTRGQIYSGPEAAYYSLLLMNRWKFLYPAYLKSSLFRRISDYLYQLIANNRSFFFRITKFLWGSNPHKLRPFWAIYLFVILYFIFI